MKSLVASVCLVALGLGLSGTATAAPPATKKIRVLLTYGGHDFEEKPFFAMFDALSDVQYTKAPLPKSAGLLKPGLEKEYDVIVRYDMVQKVSPAQEKALVELLQRGIGLVALHHNLGHIRNGASTPRLSAASIATPSTRQATRSTGHPRTSTTTR